MLTFGMRCHDVCEPMEMEKVFSIVKENNIHNIQLAMSKSITNYNLSTGNYSAGMARYIASELEKNEIHVSVLGCYINPTHPVEAKRQAEVARFIEHLKYARIMGADMVGTETGRLHPAMKVNPQTYTEDAYQLLLKSMREIVKAAEKLGVIVGVEGVYDHTLYSPERMKRFLEDIDSPNVEVILDAVNLMGPESNTEEEQADVLNRAFQYYGDKITMLHIKDYVMNGVSQEFRFVGEGQFHYRPLMKLLKERKPMITMLLENSNPQHYHKDVELLKKWYEEA